MFAKTKKSYEKKDPAGTATKKMQKMAYLKTGIAILITIGICGWVVHGLLNPKITARYNDFAIDSAVSWLENADRQDFDACRKNIVVSNGWFDWFVLDRKSLGKVKSRTLASRNELPGAPFGMKRYELKFDFSRSVSERMIIETDGHSLFKVIVVDYRYFRNREILERSVTESDKAHIMPIAEDVLKKIDARDIAFFKKKGQQPDYLEWRIADEAKRLKEVGDLCEILAKSKSSPRQFTDLRIFIPVGQTGLECSVVDYSFSVNVNEKVQNFLLRICLTRNRYQNKSAEWNFYFLSFEEKSENKRNNDVYKH